MVKRSKEKGMAMFLALMLVLLLSVIGISLAFVAQAETWSSWNYRVMTQERYGAEAGMNAAAYYLMNTYTAPATSGTDVLSNYTMTTSPVQYNGHPVVLSTTSSASNYPVAAVETAFQSAAAGSLTAGTNTLNYTASATLLAMNQVTTASGPVTVQTWSITADDPITGIRTGEEEVTGVLERQVSWGAVPAPAYGVFATGTTCGVMSFSGGITIGSYDSKSPTMSGGSVVPDRWGGDIGANGNLNESGGATVNGTFSTPRTGVGNCASGSVDAWSDSGGATVTGCNTAAPVSPATTCGTTGIVQLSQTVTYTTPTMPAAPSSWNTSTISITSTTTCTSLANSHLITASGCSGSAGNLSFTTAASPGATGFGPISISGGGKLALAAGTYNLDTINVSGGGSLAVSTSTATAATTINTNSINLSGGTSMTVANPYAVTFNVYGTSGVTLSGGTAMVLSSTASTPGVVTMNIASTVTSPWNGSGGTFSNVTSSGVPTPAYFQIMYGGTSTVTISGGAGAAAALYVPNAPISLSGGATWYGSLIGKSITDSGGASIYYDREMGGSPTATQIATVGNYMMDSFSWARF